MNESRNRILFLKEKFQDQTLDADVKSQLEKKSFSTTNNRNG